MRMVSDRNLWLKFLFRNPQKYAPQPAGSVLKV